MTQPLQTHLDLGYLGVILLLAYVLSSAPRYVRNFDKSRDLQKTEHRSVTHQVIDAGKLAVNEYVKAWKLVRQSVEPVMPPRKEESKPSLTQNLSGLLHNN